MFKELYALTERGPVLMLAAREGERLRVNLHRKQDEDEKAAPLSISILATPEELDAELPLALAEGFAMNESPAKAPSVSEQVKAQVAAAAPAEKIVEPKVRAMTGAKAKASPTKKPTASKPAKATTRTRRLKPVLRPTEQLAAVVGSDVKSHNEAMAAVWGYIKAKGLKDPKSKRRLIADDALRPIFGKDRIPVTDLAKVVKAHLVASDAPIQPEPQKVEEAGGETKPAGGDTAPQAEDAPPPSDETTAALGETAEISGDGTGQAAPPLEELSVTIVPAPGGRIELTAPVDPPANAIVQPVDLAPASTAASSSDPSSLDLFS